ncbi:MAG TPA: hypothetical protein VFX16_30990 [Pseudonocardiaceae bacterium]|nr:hypothetical protein [Pseudonocardiaceae bacterium]
MTAKDLAERAGCDPRYISEWLGGQAAGGYIGHDPATQRCTMTEEQAFALANPDGQVYLPGAFALALGALKAEPKITEAVPALDGVEAKLRAGARAADAGVTSRTSFEVASAQTFTGTGYDLVTTFDCLHDTGDPVGAARHIREALGPGGTWMIVEPAATATLEGNLNPVGRAYYSFSGFLCVPNSLSQPGGYSLGARAGVAAIRQVTTDAGFTRFRRWPRRCSTWSTRPGRNHNARRVDHGVARRAVSTATVGPR